MFPRCMSAKANDMPDVLENAHRNCEEPREQAKRRCQDHCETCRYGSDRHRKEEECRAEIRTANNLNQHDHIEWHFVENCINEKCKFGFVATPTRPATTVDCDDCWTDASWDAAFDCVGDVLAKCRELDSDVDQVGGKVLCGVDQWPRWSCTSMSYCIVHDRQHERLRVRRSSSALIVNCRSSVVRCPVRAFLLSH